MDDQSCGQEGHFERSEYDILDEIEIFKGDENSLSMVQSYTHEFQCVYQLDKYPFDTQVGHKYIFSSEMSQECFIEMDVDSLDAATVRLLPECNQDKRRYS